MKISHLDIRLMIWWLSDHSEIDFKITQVYEVGPDYYGEFWYVIEIDREIEQYWKVKTHCYE